MSAPSITDRLAGLLERTAPFDHLAPEVRAELLGEMRLEIYEPGSVVLDQGIDVHHALYIVESGLVRLMDVEQNRMIDMVGEGGQFGYYGLVQGGILPYEARAVGLERVDGGRTVCALLSADHFKRLYKQDAVFRNHFDQSIKRYVRTLDADIDASGAFLLFDTRIETLVHGPPVTVSPEASIREAAQAMRDGQSGTAIVVQDGAPVGLVTEGDLVGKVLGGDVPADASAMQLVTRPPVVLAGNERVFDAVKTMMANRIRRVVVVGYGDDEGQVVGLVTSGDVAHFRGLDPVATVERVERAGSVQELAGLRAESNRRLFRLYQQGVHSEDLLGVITELDDQLKRRLIHLAEQGIREEHPADVVDVPWAWIAFGPSGRRESALYAEQVNGLAWTPGADPDAEARYFERLTRRVSEGLTACGFERPSTGLTASEAPFRQPVGAWQAAYSQWVEGSDAGATTGAAPCFDPRAVYGDEDVLDTLREHLRGLLPNPRFLQVLARDATEATPPLSFFGGFELSRAEGQEGFDLRTRGLDPIVGLARTMALEAGYLRSASTFDRLRYVAGHHEELRESANELLDAFGQLVDLHLRFQMQQAEVGEAPTDWVDPGELHRSQQNLLKEAFKQVKKAQDRLAKRYRVA